MKKIVGGKLYNTETAECLGECSHGCRGDFSRYEEGLFRTKSGRYFLAGSGGPMTRYAHSCGQQQWCGGEDIIPVTEAEAREWGESHLSTDGYEAAFGACPEA